MVSSYSELTDNETRNVNIIQFYDDILDGRITNGTYVIKGHYDARKHFTSLKGWMVLKRSGLVKDNEMWTEARNRLSRWLFRPNKRILHQIAPYRKQTLQLGVQIRTGGVLANTKEGTVFLDDSSMPDILTTINNQLINLSSTTELYVSSDSDIMINRIVQEYSNRKVHYLNCTTRGHAAVSIRGLECAIMDIVLITESDYLVYTRGSSFGFLISNLMGFVAVPTIPSKVKWIHQ